LNPDFLKTIKLPFYFQKTQRLKFEVWDEDTPTDYEFLGSVETSVGHIMCSKAQTFSSKLKDEKNEESGTLLVRADSIKKINDILAISLSGIGLQNIQMGCFCCCANVPDI